MPREPRVRISYSLSEMLDAIADDPFASHRPGFRMRARDYWKVYQAQQRAVEKAQGIAQDEKSPEVRWVPYRGKEET